MEGANTVCWHEKRFKKPIFSAHQYVFGQNGLLLLQEKVQDRDHVQAVEVQRIPTPQNPTAMPTQIGNLIIVAAIAFIFTFCMGCFIKFNIPVDRLKTFVRKDKWKNMGFIAIAQKCYDEAFSVALLFFSDLSKNFDWVFT